MQLTIGGTGTAIGAGRANTVRILAVDANSPAARACRDYRGGGKTDWFLPSKDELNQLYFQRTVLGSFLDNTYWSSSEDGSGHAWGHSFSSARQFGGNKNDLSIRVLPVRAF